MVVVQKGHSVNGAAPPKQVDLGSSNLDIIFSPLVQSKSFSHCGVLYVLPMGIPCLVRPKKVFYRYFILLNNCFESDRPVVLAGAPAPRGAHNICQLIPAAQGFSKHFRAVLLLKDTDLSANSQSAGGKSCWAPDWTINQSSTKEKQKGGNFQSAAARDPLPPPITSQRSITSYKLYSKPPGRVK